MNVANRAGNIGRCTKCGKKEHWELLDSRITAAGDDAGQYEDIACYGEGWAPTGWDSLALSVRPDLKPLYDEWASPIGPRAAKAEGKNP